jgi:hypothetical protein
MTTIRFFTKYDIEDGDFRWSFEQGQNLLSVYDDNMVDLYVARLLVHGATKIVVNPLDIEEADPSTVLNLLPSPESQQKLPWQQIPISPLPFAVKCSV